MSEAENHVDDSLAVLTSQFDYSCSDREWEHVVARRPDEVLLNERDLGSPDERRGGVAKDSLDVLTEERDGN